MEKEKLPFKNIKRQFTMKGASGFRLTKTLYLAGIMLTGYMIGVK